MDKIPQCHSHWIVGLHPNWTNLPLVQKQCLSSSQEAPHSIEVEIPLPPSLVVKVEEIDESPFPHFNPPLPNTLDFIL